MQRCSGHTRRPHTGGGLTCTNSRADRVASWRAIEKRRERCAYFVMIFRGGHQIQVYIVSLVLIRLYAMFLRFISLLRLVPSVLTSSSSVAPFAHPLEPDARVQPGEAPWL